MPSRIEMLMALSCSINTQGAPRGSAPFFHCICMLLRVRKDACFLSFTLEARRNAFTRWKLEKITFFAEGGIMRIQKSALALCTWRAISYTCGTLSVVVHPFSVHLADM